MKMQPQFNIPSNESIDNDQSNLKETIDKSDGMLYQTDIDVVRPGTLTPKSYLVEDKNA